MPWLPQALRRPLKSQMYEERMKNMLDAMTKPGIQKIPPYIPGDTAESVKEKYGLTEVLKLASNENQLGSSPKAIEAMIEAVKQANIYPDPFCMGLRKKIGKKFGFDDSGDNVIISSGASGILSLLGEVFICEGDEVIFCEPTFGAYAGATRRNNGVPVVLPLTEDKKFDLEGMYRAITDKTKMIFICNPNNPTGTVVDSEELKAFIHKVPQHVIVVVDEAYIELSSNPEVKSMVSEIAEGVNLIVVRTFSKIYGLAGLRLGYSLMNKELHAILQKSTTVFVASREALAGAMAALDDEEFIRTTKAVMKEGREYLTRELTALGWYIYPSETNFIYGDSGLNTSLLAEELKKKGLIIRGNFEFSRITIGTMEQNRKVVEIIREVMESGAVPKA